MYNIVPKVEVKILDERVKEILFKEGLKPSSEGAAGYDLYACIDEEITIAPGDTVLVNTGISWHPEHSGLATLLLPRSGLGHKQGVVLGNLVGLIDSDYQGEMKVSVWNRNHGKPVIIKPLDRIAQMIFVPIIHPSFEFVDEFNKGTSRGSGGFGSTGVESK